MCYPDLCESHRSLVDLSCVFLSFIGPPAEFFLVSSQSLPSSLEIKLKYKSAHLMIFGRPQVGLDAAVSAGGRGRTPALSARQRRRKFWAIFLYSRHFQLTLPVLSNRIRISNFYLLLEVPSGPPPRSLDSGRDSPASGALLLGDGEKRQR